MESKYQNTFFLYIKSTRIHLNRPKNLKQSAIFSPIGAYGTEILITGVTQITDVNGAKMRKTVFSEVFLFCH